MVALGMVMSSFLTVLSLVTNMFFSTISPTESPIFTRSPITKGLMYVITIPATILAMAEVDPSEKRTPRNMDTPLKAGELEPGR